MTVVSAASRARASIVGRAIHPSVALGGLVAASFAARLVVASAKATPVMYPDEYIYSALARSLAATGTPLIRGHAAHFPALLAPILTAPAWLVGNVEAAFALALAIGAAAMSLAAVPVYLLARRLGLGCGRALALAALALLVPDLLYTAFLTSEPFAYPLALAALLAGVVALERESWRSQLAFLALATLATLARVQFVALPLAYAVAIVALGLRERRLRAALRAQSPTLGLLCLGAAGFAVVGLGYYSSASFSGIAPGEFVRAAGGNALVLAFAAGLVIVPGALLGLWLGIAHPRSRGELAFCMLTSTLAAAMLVEAALYGEATHERYLFYLAPPIAIAFALYARRGWPHLLAHGLVAATLATIVVRVPLTVIAGRGETNSPLLLALHWLANRVGGTAEASFLVMLWSLAALAATAALAGRRRAAAAWLALGLAGCLSVAGYAASADFDRANARLIRAAMLPDQRSWVDAAGVDRVPLVQSFGGRKTDALNQLFWNRSLDAVAILPGAHKLDEFATSRLQVGADGGLRRDGRPLEGPLLVDGYGSLVRLRDARLLGSAPNYDLWSVEGPARLALYFAGRFRDGWTAPRADLTVWPERGGRLVGRVRFVVRSPEAGTLRLELPGGRDQTVRLRAERPLVVELPVCRTGPWHAGFAFSAYGTSGSRIVAAHTSAPAFRPDASVCGAPAGRSV